MHRWFLIWTTLALLALQAVGFSEEQQTPPGDSPTPATAKSRHKQSGSLLQNLEDMVLQQSKQIDSQSKQVEQLGKDIEQLTNQIAQQNKQAEQQRSQIDTLTGQLTLLTTELRTANTERPAMGTSHPGSVTAPPGEALPSAPQSSASNTLAPGPIVETASASVAAATPAEPEGATHTVKKGENLISIAHHYGTTVAELLKLNKIEDERKLQIGQVLSLPKPAGGNSNQTTSPQPNKQSQ